MSIYIHISEKVLRAYHTIYILQLASLYPRSEFKSHFKSNYRHSYMRAAHHSPFQKPRLLKNASVIFSCILFLTDVHRLHDTARECVWCEGEFKQFLFNGANLMTYVLVHSALTPLILPRAHPRNLFSLSHTYIHTHTPLLQHPPFRPLFEPF